MLMPMWSTRLAVKMGSSRSETSGLAWLQVWRAVSRLGTPHLPKVYRLPSHGDKSHHLPDQRAASRVIPTVAGTPGPATMPISYLDFIEQILLDELNTLFILARLE